MAPADSTELTSVRTKIERPPLSAISVATARPRDKQRILSGVLAAIRADTVTATEERELFRVIAIALDCPLPPGVAI